MSDAAASGFERHRHYRQAVQTLSRTMRYALGQMLWAGYFFKEVDIHFSIISEHCDIEL